MDNGIIIPEYQLFIHPLDLSELRKDIWCDDPIPAKLTINKRKYDIDITYRGSHIRDFRKKSYHISFNKPSTYRNTKEIHINAEYKDPSLLRNKLSFDFFEEDYLRIEGFNTLTARILDVKTFRRQYKNLLEVILNNQFNVDYLKPKIQGMHDLIRPYVQKDPYKKDDIHLFDKEPEYILDFIEARAKYIRGKLDSLD